MIRTPHALVAVAAATLALTLIACDSSGDSDPSPTPSPPATATITPSTYVVEFTQVGCDRKEGQRGTEALALVRVTNTSGRPVLGAEVHGVIEGPNVVLGEATDATTDTGEANLFFVVDANGDYTITVTRVSGLRGQDAILDPSSTLTATNTIGDVCVWS